VQADSIMQTCESVFKVPSEADHMLTYTVDVSVIACGATEEFQLQCVFIRRVCWRVIIISNLNHFGYLQTQLNHIYDVLEEIPLKARLNKRSWWSKGWSW